MSLDDLKKNLKSENYTFNFFFNLEGQVSLVSFQNKKSLSTIQFFDGQHGLGGCRDH